MSVNGPDALGIDIGGVIIDRVSEDDQTQIMGHHGYAGAAEVDGAFEAIARLVEQRFRERTWLVSRCDEPRELVTCSSAATATRRRQYAGGSSSPTSSTIVSRS
jgi:hypothetical protein